MENGIISTNINSEQEPLSGLISQDREYKEAIHAGPRATDHFHHPSFNIQDQHNYQKQFAPNRQTLSQAIT